MYKRHHIPFFLIVLKAFCAIPSVQCSNGLDIAQQVLDKLYMVSGQYVYKKPALELSSDNERVATYSPSQNLITIDEKALAICKSMGTENANALAFLIGHELAHAFQKEVRQQNETTNFLSYDKHFHSSVRTEKVADIQGVFVGYLAGYGMQKAIPVVLEKLYIEYGLMGKKLPNYPTFEERTQSAKEVVSLVEDLTNLFEVNQYLLALKKYKLASISLEHILEYYQGFEIQNNLGVTYLYSAFEFFDDETDMYSYPIKLDTSSQLATIDKARGKPNLTERKFRNRILHSALGYFEQSINLNPNYTTAKVNRACALNLLRQQDIAFSYLNSEAFSINEKKRPEYLLILGITEALLKNNFRASNIFETISKFNNTIVADQGKHNLSILKGGEITIKKTIKPNVTASLYQTINDLKMGSTRNWHNITLNAEQGLVCKVNQMNGNRHFLFTTGYESTGVIITNRIDKNIKLSKNNLDVISFYGQNILIAKNCFYYNIEKEDVVIKCDNNFNILEIAKYF